MLRRAYFVLVVLFWVAMNVLLWRSEMGSGKDAGATVDPAQVWQRILMAPDDSSLDLVIDGRKAGRCRWVPNVSEAEATGKTAVQRESLEGQVRQLSEYTVDIDGSAMVGEHPRLIRFTSQFHFSTNLAWRRMELRLVLRPSSWEVRADAQAGTVSLDMDDQGVKTSKAWTFAELSQPETLLGSFGGAWAMTFLNGAFPGQGTVAMSPPQLLSGLRWESRLDWLKVGHSRVRVYRLGLRLLDKYQVTVYVSRVGELLRVELPGQVTLVNEALVDL